MQELLELLNELIAKYSIEDADVAKLQDILSKLEGNEDSEFEYEEEKVEE